MSSSTSPTIKVTAPHLMSKSLSPTHPLPTNQLQIGDRIIVQTSTGTKLGTLRYLGATEFADGQWAGVELDEPIGKNDGSVDGRRYFSCPMKCGLFAPTHKIAPAPSKALKPVSRSSSFTAASRVTPAPRMTSPTASLKSPSVRMPSSNHRKIVA